MQPTSADVPGHLAVPAGDGPFPAVVVVHEAFGIDDVMRRQVDRLAAAGFLALMPDLFAAGGPRRCLLTTLRAVRSGHGKAFDDVEAARTSLVDHPAGNGNVGIIGFCMGGAFALMSATRGFDVAVDNYGFLPRDPVHALAGACPVLANYGGSDRFLGSRPPGKLEQALTAANVPHEVHVYPGAGHSFLNDEDVGPAWQQPFLRVLNVGPDPDAAAVAWERIEAYLHRHLD